MIILVGVGVGVGVGVWVRVGVGVLLGVGVTDGVGVGVGVGVWNSFTSELIFIRSFPEPGVYAPKCLIVKLLTAGLNVKTKRGNGEPR